MRQKVSFLKKLGLVSLLLTTTLNYSVFGEIDSTKLKDLNELIRPEFQYLSPIEGFTLLKKGILENLYKYGNEEDQTIRLIRFVFHTVDSVSFNTTRLPSNIVSHLKTSGLGTVLNQILSDQGDLEGRLVQALLSELKLEVETPGTSQYTKKERQLLKKSTKEFAKILTGAIQETLGSEPKYPAHLPEQILLSAFWQKAENDKQEFLTLFHKIPIILKNETTISSSDEDPWLKSEYSLEEYSLEMANLLGRHAAERSLILASHSELSTFLAASYDTWEQLLPPIVSYDRAFITLEDGELEEFSDCAETSIRNFFNIALKDPQTQKFDLAFLKKKAKEKKLILHSSFLTFYEIHNQLTNLASRNIHTAWANVVSRLPKVSYNIPYDYPSRKRFCNITNGIPSILNVFGQLIFRDETWDTLKRKEKLDLIVQFFSHPGFQITWTSDSENFLNEETKYGIIAFKINGKSAFSWTFQGGHFFITQEIHPTGDWRKLLGTPLAETLSLPENQGLGLGLLTWFLDHKNLKETFETLNLKILLPSSFY